MKIVLGMSGGVDSAAAAYLLQQAGYTVYGVTLVMDPAVMPDVEGAKRTADRLGIAHAVLDCSAAFSSQVLADFADRYRDGETPNPCVVCNPTVKFAALLSYMRKIGAEKIATGHYADVRYNEQTAKYELMRGFDRLKDQSYMLYRLTQEQLAYTLFPLNGMEKPEIRALAEKNQLLPTIPKDSMDICFLPDGDYAGYLERKYGFCKQTGDFLGANGQKIGTHEGHWRYTVGQRKGLGLAVGAPIYVTEKDAQTNRVYVGAGSELFADTCILRDFCLISEPLPDLPLTAKVRYSRSESETILEFLPENHAKLTFSNSQRAMTRGQSAVIYQGERVIGGGFIEQVTR